MTKTAFIAIRRGTGGADCASVIDKAVTERIAFFRRNDLPQFHFDFLWIFDSVHKTDTVAQSDTVCICNDCRFAEDVSHDKVGAFATDARKFE